MCAEICKWCADQCGQHDHDHCKRCAEACRKCVKECESMAASAA
ncbi:four-helix bundle copper-binding protein [Stieleria magnilauensis]